VDIVTPPSSHLCSDPISFANVLFLHFLTKYKNNWA
jgi:hypothetical protein